MVVVEPHPLYAHFLPFGVGQFQNDDRAKGVAVRRRPRASTLGDERRRSGATSSTSTACARRSVPLDDAPARAARCSRSRSAPASRSSASTAAASIDAYRPLQAATPRPGSTSRCCRPSSASSTKPKRQPKTKQTTSFHVVPMLDARRRRHRPRLGELTCRRFASPHPAIRRRSITCTRRSRRSARGPTTTSCCPIRSSPTASRSTSTARPTRCSRRRRPSSSSTARSAASTS